jgi:MFS family permease
MLQVFYYSTLLFISSGLTEERAKFATIGIGAIMVGMTLMSIPLMDRTGRRTLHLYGLGGMFIFSIFITISFLIKVCNVAHTSHVISWAQRVGCGVQMCAVYSFLNRF